MNHTQHERFVRGSACLHANVTGATGVLSWGMMPMSVQMMTLGEYVRV